MTNIERAQNALNIFYRNAALQFRGFTPQSLTDYYNRRSPSFLNSFGSTLVYETVTAAKIETAMGNLGRASAASGNLPDPYDFYQAMIGEVTGWRWADTVDVLKQTGNEVASAAKTVAVGVASYYAIAGLLAVYLLFKARR